MILSGSFPQSSLGQDILDTLSDLSLSRTDVDHDIIYHCFSRQSVSICLFSVVKLTSCRLGLAIYQRIPWSRARLFLVLFNSPECIVDPTAFHLLLAQSAYDMCALRNEPPSRRAIVHKAAGLSIVNARLSDPALAVCDGNIMAATIMVSIEVCIQHLKQL
jgi:hypothetical protein